MKHVLPIAMLILAAAMPAVAMDDLVPIAPDEMPGLLPGGMPGIPGEEGAEAPPPPQSVRVFLDSDVVHMKDGSILKGTVILQAAKSTILLTDEGEELIPSEDIEKIERGHDQDKPVRLPIEKCDGFQFIVMEPMEETEQPAVSRAPQEEKPRQAKTETKTKTEQKPREQTKPEKVKELDNDEIKRLKEDPKMKELFEQLNKKRKSGGPPPQMPRW